MPLTSDGAERLAAELERAHELVDPPELVWLFLPDTFHEQRADLHAWCSSRTGPRQALVVWHEYPLRDRVEWVCEPYLRPRHE